MPRYDLAGRAVAINMLYRRTNDGVSLGAESIQIFPVRGRA
jgi:hypothetical protein